MYGMLWRPVYKALDSLTSIRARAWVGGGGWELGAVAFCYGKLLWLWWYCGVKGVAVGLVWELWLLVVLLVLWDSHMFTMCVCEMVGKWIIGTVVRGLRVKTAWDIGVRTACVVLACDWLELHSTGPIIMFWDWYEDNWWTELILSSLLCKPSVSQLISELSFPIHNNNNGILYTQLLVLRADGRVLWVLSYYNIWTSWQKINVISKF